MFRILIDTCVWLDLAKEFHHQSILGALEELIRQRDIELILPRTVVDEFARNKARIIEESGHSLSTTIKRVKEAVDKFGDPRQKDIVLAQLNEVDHRLPMLGEAAVSSVSRIEKLFNSSTIIEISDSVKLRAAQRAIDKLAPFHRQRNGIGDSILLEVYIDAIGVKTAGRKRFAFITHNTKDFSHPTANNKLPHPDIAGCFSHLKSLYFITLGEALRRVQPKQFNDLMIENEWLEEPRRLSEIVEAIDELLDKIWYGRHLSLKYRINEGLDTVNEEIWKGALQAAQRVIDKYGEKNLGPYSDFEWGMINGKLSALRWALGDEWDMLDT